MNKISRAFIDTLIQSVPIVDFMENEFDSYFLFNKRTKWASTNCPMPDHDDNSPSFGVNSETNLFHCFGCGEKGDIIRLVQKVEGLSFVEAIQRLADYANIDVELANLDIKSILKELSTTINDYFVETNEHIYPGGLSEISFLIAFSDRTKKHIRQSNFNKDEINWTDMKYKTLDNLIEKKDINSIEKIWFNFSKESKERLKLYEI